MSRLNDILNDSEIRLTGYSEGVDIELEELDHQELEELLANLDRDIEILEEVGELRSQWVRFALQMARKSITGMI